MGNDDSIRGDGKTQQAPYSHSVGLGRHGPSPANSASPGIRPLIKSHPVPVQRKSLISRLPPREVPEGPLEDWTNAVFRPDMYKQPVLQKGLNTGVPTTIQAEGVEINTDSELEREAGEMGAKAARGERASTSLQGAARPAEHKRSPEVIPSSDLSGTVVQCQQDPSSLSPAAINEAIRYNRQRAYPEAVWQQIATIVGAGNASLTPELIHCIASWQGSRHLEADGKVADITLQWLSREANGAGLDAYIRDDATIYLGLNPDSRTREFRALRNSPGDRNAVAANGSAQQDQVSGSSAERFDLTTNTGVDGFLATLTGLADSRRNMLRSFLQGAVAGSRDELAQFVRFFHEAETGRRIIRRVVLSGHSAGDDISGEDDNYTLISFSSLSSLNQIFPIACSQVEDLMLSACNTGHRENIQQYLQIFPNLQTIWAYAGYSPSPPGSEEHIRAWAAGTQGPSNAARLEAQRRRVASNRGRHSRNVAIWTRSNGATQYNTSSPDVNQGYTTLRNNVDQNLRYYVSALEQGQIDEQQLDSLYNELQVLVNNYQSELGAEHAYYYDLMRRTLYLRHWNEITVVFMEDYGSELTKAYEAAQAVMPAYRLVPRDRVLQQINSFPGDRNTPVYESLVSWLKNLEPAAIGERWRH